MSGKILIVDDVATSRIVLKARLAAACYQLRMATDALGCLEIARSEHPDVILLSHRLADVDGLAALTRLRADPLVRHIPVIYLAPDFEPGLRLAAIQAGADDFMAKPYDDQMLMARLRNLVRGRQDNAPLSTPGLAEEAATFERPGRTVLIALTPETGHLWRQSLATHLPSPPQIMTPGEALATASPIDIFVLQADCSRTDHGLHLLSELRSRPTTRHAAICVINTQNNAEGVAIAYDLGANQVVPADFDPTELGLRLTKLLRRKQHADNMRASVADSMRAAVTDDLTGLWNRRYALAQLPAIVRHSHAAGLPYTLLVLDLDRFKSVNDRFGHNAGDHVLVEVARRFAANLREGDLLARMGGEEFLVGLPDTSLEQGQMIAERLCRMVEARPCLLPDGTELAVTVSIGLASGLPERAGDEVPSDVIDRADQAMLRAKSTGRNRVSIAKSAA